MGYIKIRLFYILKKSQKQDENLNSIFYNLFVNIIS